MKNIYKYNQIRVVGLISNPPTEELCKRMNCQICTLSPEIENEYKENINISYEDIITYDNKQTNDEKELIKEFQDLYSSTNLKVY